MQSHKPFTPPISVCGSDVHNHMRAIRRHKPAYQLRGISQARNEDLSWRCLIELGSYYIESQTSWYCALWLMA